jgi:hypothetical protein
MITFKEFIKEQDENPYQTFLKMRHGLGWGDLKQAPKGTATAVADAETTLPTRTMTRNPLEIKLSNEVQAGHKMGSIVPRSVIARMTANNPEDIRSFIAPDRLKAGQIYPFIQQRQAGRDVGGIVYNQMFPLHSLLRLLNLH